MNRRGMILCALFGHTWTDYSIDYRPDFTQRYERCRRCQTWTKREVLDRAPWDNLEPLVRAAYEWRTYPDPERAPRPNATKDGTYR